MKRKNIKLALVMFLLLTSGMSMSSCGNSNVSFILKPIPNCVYGDQLDFKEYVELPSGVVASYTLTSLTPDTVTIDNDRSVAMITGAGDCKVEVAIGKNSQIASFTSYASVSGIELSENNIQAIVGDTLNLDEIVNVKVSAPQGAKGEYIATSMNADIAEISSDGKNVSFLKEGDFLIEIKDLARKKSAYLTGNVLSKLQNKVLNFAKALKNNYTVYHQTAAGGFTQSFTTIHAPNYIVYPYGFLLGSSWNDSIFAKDNQYFYYGFATFENGSLYEFHAKYKQNENKYYEMDTSTILPGSKKAVDPSLYFTSLDASILESFHFVHNEDAEVEDYLSGKFSRAFYEMYVGDALGISLSGGTSAYDEVRIYMDEVFEHEAMVVQLVNNENPEITYAFTTMGEEQYAPLTAYLSDSKNNPTPINPTLMKDRIQGLVDNQNFTVTGRTFVSKDGVELSVSEATQYFEPLHTYIMGFQYRFTEDAALSTEIIRWKGVTGASFTSDRTTTKGYVNQDGKCYMVDVPTRSEGSLTVEDTTVDENDNVTYQGLTLLSTPVNDNGGYQDSVTTLKNFNFDAFDQFDFLKYDEEAKQFTFSIVKNGAEAMKNLRVFADISAPDYSNKIFPNKGDNSFEAGYAGAGTFTLNEDGGFAFSYYVSTIVSGTTTGGVYEFELNIEMTYTNIGTTTIDELQGLSFKAN